MQEDEEGANYSYDIPIDELLDSVSDGEKEPVEEKPGLGRWGVIRRYLLTQCCKYMSTEFRVPE